MDAKEAEAIHSEKDKKKLLSSFTGSGNLIKRAKMLIYYQQIGLLYVCFPNIVFNNSFHGCHNVHQNHYYYLYYN